jgi:hypothetical protein
MARFDRQLRYSFVNSLLMAETGLTEDQFIGKTTEEIAPLMGVPAGRFDNWMRDLQKVLTTAWKCTTTIPWSCRITPFIFRPGCFLNTRTGR